jgi:ABC-type glycerol-3-phosphate transport system substrate-binding protein
MGFIEEVTDEMLAGVEDFADFSPAAIGTMSYQDKLYGLPFQYHTPVLFYRTDLFEAAGLAGPPETWEQYREYAKLLTDPSQEIFGTCLEAKAVPEPVTHLMDFMAQNGAHYMDAATGNAIFDSPQTREVYQFMYDIQNVDKSSPPGALGYDNTDVYTVFMQGKVAMVSQWPYFYAASQDPAQSQIVGKVGVAPQPGGSSALWAFGHGISSASRKKEAAWEFCKWGSETEVIAKLSITQTTPVPRASANEIVYASSELSDETKGVLRTLTDAANKAVSYTITPNFPAVQSRLMVTTSNIMSGLATIEDEVVATQRDLEGILAQ